MHFLLIVFVFLFINNTIDKILSVNLCEKNGKIRPTFEEIFGQEWENERETDQNANNHQNDQNDLNFATLIDNTNQNWQQLNDQQKREIVHKFHAIKERIKKRGKYSKKVWNKLERKISKKLGIKRKEIYKWKKEIGIYYYKKKKQEFIKRIDEIKRTSENGKQKQFAKELGISKPTLRKWKKEFGIEMGKSRIRFTDEQKMSKMNDYLKMKKANPSLSDKEIAGILKIGFATLKRWKKENNS